MRFGARFLTTLSMLALVGSVTTPVLGQSLGTAQPKQVADAIPARTLGEGPWPRTVLRNAIYVDGTGAPAQGPVDIVIENDRIVQIVPDRLARRDRGGAATRARRS